MALFRRCSSATANDNFVETCNHDLRLCSKKMGRFDGDPVSLPEEQGRPHAVCSTLTYENTYH